ncbi:MAG: hypothetical protein AB7P04_15490 [Bacteriovoracia bacterium]
MKSPVFIFYLLSALFCGAFSAPIAEAAEVKRKATLKWGAVAGAKKYELQFSRTPDMAHVIYRKRFDSPSAQVQLAPGTYFFRIRGIDANGQEGPWTKAEGFRVNQHPPNLLEPRNRTVFDLSDTQLGFRFQWTAVKDITKYKIEISDKNGVVLKDTSDSLSYSWKPKVVGEFFWRVGFETNAGAEWSDKFTFTLKGAGVEETQTSTTTIIQEGNDPEFWSILRFAQSAVTYEVDDRDAAAQTSAFAFVPFFNAELRWRARRKPNEAYLLSGSVNFELLRQNVAGTVYSMPRVFARFFYTERMDRWRVGPFVQGGFGRVRVFYIDNPGFGSGQNVVQASETSRSHAGVGGVALYNASSTFYFSLLAAFRYDFGGSVEGLSNKALIGAGGTELGFGIVTVLGVRTMLETRLRYIKESFPWVADDTLQTRRSYSANSFIIVDLGFGYRF